MKINKTIEVDIRTLHVSAGVRYWEDSSVNEVPDENGTLIPCRKGDRWEPVIDIESGKIINWEQGKTANIHYKVCDDGKYELRDAAGSLHIGFEDYVPRCLCPEENGYGDYIIMKIDKDGLIDNWIFRAQDFKERNDD